MVNNPSQHPPAAESQHLIERRIVLSYAPAGRRGALAALLAFDDTLAGILRSTRQAMIGQMRLTWWHDAVVGLADAAAPAEPVLQSLARDVVPHVPVDLLARIVVGWEELIDPDPLDPDRLRRFADGRGGGLFEAAALAFGGVGDPNRLIAGGRAWALMDLAEHVSDAATNAMAQEQAAADLSIALGRRWPRAQRSLGAMVRLAAMADASPPKRAARMLWHRLTGR